MHVDAIVSRLVTSERHLADAFVLVSDRHGRNPEIRDVARTIAAWSAEHVDLLDEVMAKYGTKVTKQPDRLRSALFHDPRVGGIGLVQDLHDLTLLAHDVELLWIELRQAAHALFDHELAKTCIDASEHTKRQLRWLLSQIKDVSPQAIAVPAEPAREVEASVPRTVAAPALPDVVWGPLVATALLALVGIGSLASGQPWLMPRLGPAAYLIAVDWAHPSARAYNTIVGHLVGLGQALDMMLTGERIDAAEAHRIGLVSRVFPDADTLFAEAMRIAEVIASKPPVAASYVKEAARSGASMSLGAALQHERDLFALLLSTEDRVEAAKAFKEKRAPNFTGR